MNNDQKSLVKQPNTLTDGIDPQTEHSIARTIAKVKQIAVELNQTHRQTAVRHLRHVPALVELIKSSTAGTDYKVVMSPELSGRIQEESAYLGKKIGGLLSASVHDSKTGKFLGQVSLKQIDADITPAVHQLAIQNALASVSQQLEMMDQKLDDILEGQHNDRTAFVHSGVAIFQQAIAVKQEEVRHQLLFMAIQELNHGCQSLIQELEADVAFFEDDNQKSASFNVRFAMSKDVKALRAKALRMQKAFQGVLQASYALAWIYGALDEPDAIQTALLPVEETAKRFGEKGYEVSRWLPNNDDKTPEKIWSEYLQLANQATEASKQLCIPAQLQLELKFTTDEILRDV